MANSAFSGVLQSISETFRDLKGKPADDVMPMALVGDPRFHDLLKKMAEMHERKAMDYGDQAAGDPFANIRRSAQAVGLAPWRAAFLRAMDKVHRICEFAKKGTLANEGVEDSLMDLAAYALICLVMLEEERTRAV